MEDPISLRVLLPAESPLALWLPKNSDFLSFTFDPSQKNTGWETKLKVLLKVVNLLLSLKISFLQEKAAFKQLPLSERKAVW